MMFLSGENLLFTGGNKNVYQHPSDLNKCVKISIKKPDLDIQLELEFRQICLERAENSKLIPQYFGEIETNLETGYMFELIRDFDGKLSETFEAFVKRDDSIKNATRLLKDFRTRLFKEEIVTYTIFPDNLMVQRISETEQRIRIIDGIGMHVLLPIPYFSSRVAKAREKRVWRKFLDSLLDIYER